MHQHIYISGAIHGNIVRRYCFCGTTIVYKDNIKVIEAYNDDLEYYRNMAEQLLAK